MMHLSHISRHFCLTQDEARVFWQKLPACSSVTKLREAGALVLSKTVTAEFASDEPGPTRNPHHLEHTPGGSSSGSAAAVAAGFCSLALGTQTGGSVIRPAAFCGIVGFKPTSGRIATEGIIPHTVSVDTIGLFTQDVAGILIAASLLCCGWRDTPAANIPVLAVPDGSYLAQASPEALTCFEQHLMRLEKAGYTIKRVALPAGRATNGLPLGAWADERLLAWA